MLGDWLTQHKTKLERDSHALITTMTTTCFCQARRIARGALSGCRSFARFARQRLKALGAPADWLWPWTGWPACRDATSPFPRCSKGRVRRLMCRQTTIDPNQLSSDKAAILAGEEGDEVGDIFWFTEIRKQQAGRERLAQLRCHVSRRSWRQNGSRQNRICSNVVSPILSSNVERETVYARLGGTIGGPLEVA